jgi:hypothetical protein
MPDHQRGEMNADGHSTRTVRGLKRLGRLPRSAEACEQKRSISAFTHLVGENFLV